MQKNNENAECSVDCDEEARLLVLMGVNILDSEREFDFDAICRLVKIYFDIDIVAISMVDRDRQWFKASIGIVSCETPRNISLCSHTVLGRVPFEVVDTRLDPRFSNNPMVVNRPHIRYYCGFPIIVQGMSIGSLCISSYQPRQPLTKDSLLFGEICASLVASIIVRRKLYRDAVSFVSTKLS